MAVDADRLVAGLGSNHILGVAGVYTEELRHFCALAEIEPRFFA
jgi:hypothetical protein